MAEVPLHMTTTKRIALAAAVLAVLSGCADDTDELRAKIAEVKSRPGGRIEPLPEVTPYALPHESKGSRRSLHAFTGSYGHAPSRAMRSRSTQPWRTGCTPMRTPATC